MEEKSLSTVPDWIKEMATPTDLDPDLVPYLEESPSLGPILRHPLVFSVPYTPLFNAMLNRQYTEKRRRLDEALEEREWTLYVVLHERPYRLQAFLEIRDCLTPKEYWEVLGWIWSDSENLWQNKRVWRDLLRADLPHREAMMDDDERDFLSHLPDFVRVFRGYQAKNRNGMSWSLSYTVAEWFARRFSPRASGVVSGLVRKDRIKALLLGRGEVEVVVLPEHVEDRKVFEVPERDYDLEWVFDHAWAQAPLNHRGRTFHGRSHWDKVDANAIRLCAETPGADLAVCRLFAALHDSRRENEGDDPDHGFRAGDLIEDLDRQGKLGLSPDQLHTLMITCHWHNHRYVSDDPTTGVCWDADRLDLVRVGALPDPDLLSTEAARRLICQI